MQPDWIARLSRAVAIGSLLFVLVPALTGCSSYNNWSREYYLRFWEASRIRSERAMTEGDFGRAEHFALESVKYAENFGEDDFRLAASLDDLARIYKAEKQDDRAELAWRRSVNILERAVAKPPADVPKHLLELDLARVQAELAQVRANKGDWNEAASLLKRSTESYLHNSIFNSPTGKNLIAPVVMRNLSNLGDGMAAIGNRQEAANCYKLALDLSAYSLSQSKLIAHIKERYSEILKAQGAVNESEQLKNPDKWSAVAAKASQAMECKKYTEAEALYRDAWPMAQQFPKGDNRRVLTLRGIAQALAWQKSYAEAVRYYKLALDEQLSSGNYLTAQTDSLLSKILSGNTNWPEVVQLANKQLDIRSQLYGENDETTVEPLICLANGYHGLGEDYKARPYGERAWKILQKTTSQRRQLFYRLQELLSFYVATGDALHSELILNKLSEFPGREKKVEELRRNVESSLRGFSSSPAR